MIAVRPDYILNDIIMPIYDISLSYTRREFTPRTVAHKFQEGITINAFKLLVPRDVIRKCNTNTYTFIYIYNIGVHDLILMFVDCSQKS